MAEDAVAVAPAPAAAPVAPAPAAPAAGGTTPAQTPSESASGAQTGEKQPEQKTDDQPDKRGQARLQRRIDKAYRDRGEALARAEFFQKQYEETRRSQPPSADPNAPKLEQYESIEKFQEAIEKHASEKTRKQFETERQTNVHRQAERELTSNWESLIETADEKYPDFHQVVGDLKPTDPWAIGIMATENGHDIGYYLGTHIDEAQRITKLPPYKQLIEVGKLAHKLSLEPSKPKPSKAPAPISPLSGAANADPNTPGPNDDTATWIKKRNAQLRARGM